ncbi:MAG TPA: HEAT repeat domain-containing protein [Planctomycetota bacterium]|nr:HEAT repeat domain-containing protein [Planctomycetota bacterium]
MNRATIGVALGALLFCGAVLHAQDLEKVKKDLRSAVERENIKDTEEAVKGFIILNNEKAAKELCSLIKWVEGQTSNEAIYWILIKGLASFSNVESLEPVASFVVENGKKPVARDIMFMMQNNYSANCVFFCLPVAKGSNDEIKVMAIDHLGVLQSRDAVAPLIELLKTEKNSEVRRRIGKALYAITGADYGDNVTNWQGWVAQNKDKPAGEGPSKSYSGGNVMTGLDKPRENDIERVKKLPPEMIVVIRGGPHDPGETARNGGKEHDHNFDHIEQTLSKLGIPHIDITKEEFEKGFDLKGRAMVLINCTQWREHCVCPDCGAGQFTGFRLYQCVCKKNPAVHISKDYRLSDAAVQRIKQFVDAGGYLFSEDWVLGEVLNRAWPTHLKEGDYMQEEKSVGVLPEKGNTSHPYLKRIFSKPPRLVGKGTGVAPAFDEIKHQWKIDKESPLVSIADTKNVVVLMISKDLGVNDSVAVTWISGGKKEELIGTGRALDSTRFTGGRVLHVLSHFSKQKSETDEYTLQNLLVNFFIEASERWFANKAADNKK